MGQHIKHASGKMKVQSKIHYINIMHDDFLARIGHIEHGSRGPPSCNNTNLQPPRMGTFTNIPNFVKGT